jgi:hypothetical protein
VNGRRYVVGFSGNDLMTKYELKHGQLISTKEVSTGIYVATEDIPSKSDFFAPSPLFETTSDESAQKHSAEGKRSDDK